MNKLFNISIKRYKKMKNKSNININIIIKQMNN